MTGGAAEPLAGNRQHPVPVVELVVVDPVAVRVLLGPFPLALDPPAQPELELAAEPGVVCGLVAVDPGFMVPLLPELLAPVPAAPPELLAPPAPAPPAPPPPPPPPPAANATAMVATRNPAARMFFLNNM
jgi:hypothetical protein